MNKIRVLIGDDQAMLREGLAILLNNESDIEVLEEPFSLDNFAEVLRETSPDVLLIDLDLLASKKLNLDELRELSPTTRIIILSSMDLDEYVHKTLNEGALGFISKQAPSSEVAEAIQRVNGGHYYLSPPILTRVIQTYLEGTRTKPRGDKDNNKYLGYNKLSDREKEVFKLLLEGQSSRQISEDLDISPKTVDKHRASIFTKTGVENTTQLLHYAIDLELLPAARNSGPAYH